jgi:hypothetical protein
MTFETRPSSLTLDYCSQQLPVSRSATVACPLTTPLAPAERYSTKPAAPVSMPLPDLSVDADAIPDAPIHVKRPWSGSARYLA